MALLSEKTVADAAAKADVNEKTLRRWMSDDEAFQAEYAAARTAAYQAGIYRAQELTGRAMDTLEALLDETKHPNVRLGAARTVSSVGYGPDCGRANSSLSSGATSIGAIGR